MARISWWLRFFSITEEWAGRRRSGSQTAALLPITARVKPGAVLSQSHDKGRDNSFGLKSL